jgi:predicted enzyme related to lactoylglutathione lyase
VGRIKGFVRLDELLPSTAITICFPELPGERKMNSVSIGIDVPSLEVGVRFYSAAFGFSRVAEPYPGVVILRAGETSICLLEKPPGSGPSPNTTDKRRYERHWTPVHLDFHVENLAEAIDRAVGAGAVVEQQFGSPKHGSAAFCSDPFGHGFCLIERAG